MTETINHDEITGVWRNGRVPVVYKPDGTEPLIVRIPFRNDNRDWLLGRGRSITWVAQFHAWALPRGRFNDIIERALQRYESCYVIQEFRPLQKCCAACWDAKNFDCECSCLGANHGSGAALEYVVDEVVAFEWSGRQLSCRLLTRKENFLGGVNGERVYMAGKEKLSDERRRS
jgi:hypothetical protein